jgi:diketogulonate reductase-like aldo/keto reductase
MHESWITSAAGVRCPRIVYGTAWKKHDTERLVTLALQQGFRGIDTACQPRHYHEPGVGAALAACLGEIERSAVHLQTKFTPVAGQDPASIPYDPRAPLADQVLESCAASLRNLRTDHLDALLLHSPLDSLRQTLEAWRAMETLVAAGTVRQLGISNCYQLEVLEELHQRAQIKPAVVQNRFYARTGYDREIRAFCREHGIIYQSFWTLTANPHLLSSATLTLLAARHACEPEQVLFRYLTQHDVVPLTGTRSEQHMRQDLAIFELELADEECRTVDALLG